MLSFMQGLHMSTHSMQCITGTFSIPNLKEKSWMWGSYHVPGTVAEARNTALRKKIKIPAMIMREQINKQNVCAKYIVCWMENCTPKRDKAVHGVPGRESILNSVVGPDLTEKVNSTRF